MVVLLALTATATTGSTNPVVWTQHAASGFQSVGHAPEAIPAPPQPAPEQSPPKPVRSSAPAAPVPAPTHQPQHSASPPPGRSEQPEDSHRSDTRESSIQWSGHWGPGSTANTTSRSSRHSGSREEN
jgi:hypothetical protein